MFFRKRKQQAKRSSELEDVVSITSVDQDLVPPHYYQSLVWGYKIPHLPRVILDRYTRLNSRGEPVDQTQPPLPDPEMWNHAQPVRVDQKGQHRRSFEIRRGDLELHKQEWRKAAQRLSLRSEQNVATGNTKSKLIPRPSFRKERSEIYEEMQVYSQSERNFSSDYSLTSNIL